jgi:glycosyltransferase involved in cell wall biosynthesis
MKLMVVGHPFLFAYNQRKYVAMKRLDPELRLRLVVPSRGRERFDAVDHQVHQDLSREEVVPLKTWLGGWHMTYLHNPVCLAAVLRDFQPDVIHIEEEAQALITVETIALRRAFAPTAAVSAFTWDNLLRGRRFPLGTVKQCLRNYSLRRLAAMICGNRRSAELLKAEGRFAGAIEVLPQYGLDVAEHQPGRESTLRSELGLEGVPVIGYVGRMVPEKGLRLLFEALSSLQNYPWKLLLVGSGPIESEIRQRWMAQIPGRIVLLPAVPYEQVARHLRCADIFVLASYSTPSWAEQFGLVLAQAMMLGVACLGSRSGAIPDVLGPGGLCFAEGNVGELAQALESLLDSPARRNQLAAQGRQFALQNYTAEGIAEKYLDVFERARKRGVRQDLIESPHEFQSASDPRR